MFWVASAVCVLAVVVALRRRDAVAGTRVGDRWLLVAPLLLLAAVQFVFAFRGYLRTSLLPGMQGRYWFGGLAGLAVVVALGVGNLARRWIQWLPLGMLAGVALMQTTAILTLLGYYWGEPGRPSTDGLRAVVAWAPLPGEIIAVGALLGAVALATTVAQTTGWRPWKTP